MGAVVVESCRGRTKRSKKIERKARERERERRYYPGFAQVRGIAFLSTTHSLDANGDK